MKSFIATCLAALSSAYVVVESGVAMNQDMALTAVYAGMDVPVNDAVTGENRDLAAQQATDAMLGWFNSQMTALPEVCDGGATCRGDITLTTTTSVKSEWQYTLERIDKIFQDTYIKSAEILNNAWEEAYMCDPECKCQEISTEYLDVIRL